MQNTFYEKLNKRSNKNMYNYLKNHFQYYTMNSWNGCKSVANNVKVYNIGLDYSVLEILQEDNYFQINEAIKDFEAIHKDYEVGFNGQSAGYLVITKKDKVTNILDDYICFSNDYEDFKAMLKDDGYTLKDYSYRLIEQFNIVRDFDKLCDDLRNICLWMLENYRAYERV